MQKGCVLSEQSKPKGFVPILIILGVVSLLGVVGGVYYYFQPQPIKYGMGFVSTPPEVIKQIQTSTPSSNIDETANWKTYTNTKLNLSFKYPSNYNTQEQTLGSLGEPFFE